MYSLFSVFTDYLFQGVYKNIKGDGIRKRVGVQTEGCLECLVNNLRFIVRYELSL